MIIFHIAEQRRWNAAKLAGSYAWSTHGRTLDDEGFIHASHEDQWRAVRDTFYDGVTDPLVLLMIDTDRLTSPWREDHVGEQTFPHIYGPLNPSAVIEERPVREDTAIPAATRAGASGPTQSFMQLFVGEFIFRLCVGVGVMALSAALGFTGAALWGDNAALWGMLVGLVVGVLIAVAVIRARNQRLKRPATPT